MREKRAERGSEKTLQNLCSKRICVDRDSRVAAVRLGLIISLFPSLFAPHSFQTGLR